MIWRFLIGPILGFLSRLVGPFMAYRAGKASAERDAAVDASERADEGRKGAAKAKADLKAGKTPQQIKEENDASWR